MKKTAKIEIIKTQYLINVPLGAHEFGNIGYSENNIATRLSELALIGIMESNYREGKRFKEWKLTDKARRMFNELIASGMDNAAKGILEAFTRASKCEMIG